MSVRGADDVLAASADIAASTYQPTTRKTRLAYEQLLGVLQKHLGDQPTDVLASAAEEVLVLLKGELHSSALQREVQSLLGTAFETEDFGALVDLGRRITDFAVGGEDASGVASGAGGSAGAGDIMVVLNDEDDEEEGGAAGHAGYVVDSDDEAEDDGGDTSAGHALGTDAADTSTAAVDDEGGLAVRDIDAYWLQRAMAEHYADATEAQAKAEEALAVLALPDGRLAEQRLVLLLDYDKFAFIKQLLTHRHKLVWVTRWRRSEAGAARTAVEDAMRADEGGDGPMILAKLQAGTQASSSAGGRTRDTLARKSRGKEGSQTRGGLMEGTQVAAATGAGRASALAPSETLDLSALTFKSGARTMTNAAVNLPEDAWRAVKTGYEEVHVPAKAAPAAAPGELFPIPQLPEWMHAAFKGMKTLNRVQSRLRPCALERDENLLLCAPTGAGKTNVAVMTILQTMAAHRDAATGELDLAQFKIVYIAPMKALVQEVVANLTQRIGEPYGLNVRELSGDVNMTKGEIAATQIIVSTPEKWDVVTRKAGDRMFTQQVRCVIIDEIHLLHDDRGPVLECLVARTRRQEASTKQHVRLVGLSATLPNYEDVATFLGVNPATGLFFFDGSYRPCPLQQQYIGVTERKPLKRLGVMNNITYDKLLEQAGKNQALVFVHTRKDTAATAKFLRDTALERDELSRFLREDSASREILMTEAEGEDVSSDDLKSLLPHGFAIHHAGMTRTERTLVEELFADGHVQVLVSTATLAWGVNLPAHAVIIKGTQVYNPEVGAWQELSPQDVMQMLGRAGRPQYDTFGEGIIITSHDKLQYYLSLMNQQLPIESQMVSRLADCLNAEVVAGNVGTLADAAHWLTYTYLYWRMLQAPTLYGLQADVADRDPTLKQRRVDLAHAACLLLDKHNLIRYDRRGGSIQPTPLGRVASHYYVVHPTIAAFNANLKPHMTEIDLFRVFSLAHEFRNIVIRQAEREELRKVLERVPVPVKEGVEEPTAKVNALLQAYISRLGLDGYALNADMVYIRGSAGRLVRAMFEICLKRGWAELARRTLDLSNQIGARQWKAATPLRQFTPGLPEPLLRSLETKDLDWERYWDLTPAELGELVRAPKLGKTIHRLVHAFPKLKLHAAVQPITRSVLKVDLSIAADFVWEQRYHGGAIAFWILVVDADGVEVLHHQPWFLQRRYAQDESVVTFTMPLPEVMPPQYFVRVVADRWLSCEVSMPISFRHLVLPAKHPPSTELLDLAPLAVSAVKSAEAEAILTTAHGATAAAATQGGLPASAYTDAADSVITGGALNPIQTQVFPAVFESSENVLVAAPAGSGLGSVAELALLRLFNEEPQGSAVYVVGHPSRVTRVFEALDFKFGRGLDKAVVELTGDSTADARLLAQSNIAVASASMWDKLSRNWDRTRAVTQVRLFLIDDLHLVGSPGGATLEAVVSRIRNLQFHLNLEPAPRIVALSAPVANSWDVGDWVGATRGRSIFSFSPKVRPTPLEIRLQTFDIPDFATRLLAMARPAFAALSAHCAAEPGDDRPGILYTPSRKQAVLSAIDAVTYAAADGDAHRFVPCSGSGDREAAKAATAAALHEVAATVEARDPSLAVCLRVGVAYYSDSMSADLRSTVEQLWAQRQLGLVAADSACGWHLPMRAHCVVVLGTQRYHGVTHSYVDYPVADMLQLLATATVAPSGAAHAVILCASHRRNFLRKFLYEPLPVESSLELSLHDHLNTAVVSRMVENTQGAINWLTWTLLYRRFAKNPNFYNLADSTPKHVNDHMSLLLEGALTDLEASGCIAQSPSEEHMGLVDLSPLNLGLIASHHYLAYTTLEVFASSITERTGLKGFLDVLSHASEFASLPIRWGEEATIRKLARHAPVALTAAAAAAAAGGDDESLYAKPSVKANILLQSHFSRKRLPGGMFADLQAVLPQSISLLQALVDVVASSGWLKPALACMELSQMVVQGVWINADAAELLQIPHFTPELAAAAGAVQGAGEDGEGVQSVLDLMEMEPEARGSLLGSLSPQAVADVAAFCNRFPQMELSFKALVEGGNGVIGGSAADEDDEPVLIKVSNEDTVAVGVTLQREEGAEGMQEGAGLGAVIAPRYPKAKTEAWWVLVGDLANNVLYSVKRVTVGQRRNVKVVFPAPASPGEHELTLYLMCDSYVGCDQEYQLRLSVHEAEGGEEDDAELA